MSAELSLTSTLTLPNTSIQIPRLGFGVYRSNGSQCTTSCLIAIQSGYRHIDTAQFYTNEAEVGAAVNQSGLPRSEIFVTSKIIAAQGSVEKSYRLCVESVEKIDPGENGYVDLFLVHSPNGGAAKRKEMWLALERLHSEGRAKAIGVSNYGIRHIEEMKSYASVWPPAVNQIELHPWCQQRDIDAYCQSKGIVVEAYSPLVRNMKGGNETLVEISKNYGVTAAQILVRYCLQKNWVPLPKSDTPSRIVANADVYGFNISKADMEKLDNLDQGDRGAIVQAVMNS